jgi:hypothetical protein
MSDWLARWTQALARESGRDPADLELDASDTELLLDLASFAAHESGARLNAPLLCYLIGRASTGNTTLHELDQAVRGTARDADAGRPR